MQKPKHIVFVAGEESGDFHAATVIRELLVENPGLKISGIGGKHMQNAGVELLMDLAQHGVTGFSEVFKQVFTIKKAFACIKAHLAKTKPDLLILVDYPGFNLRLAQYVKAQLGLRILYYIGPQIWAWKAGRIKTIQNTVDRMAVILPFEKPIYEKAGVPVSFVGHPLAHKIPNDRDLGALRLQLKLPLDKKILAILPGSRPNEIQRHMPILVETAKILHQRMPGLHFVVPVAESLQPSSVQKYFEQSSLPLSLITGQALKVMAASDCVVVASGTASLECALSLKPMCIVYKASRLTYCIAMKVIRVKYLGLCNLLANKLIVPEFVQDDFNREELSKALEVLLQEGKFAKEMIKNLERVKQGLSSQKADNSMVNLIKEELKLLEAT